MIVEIHYKIKGVEDFYILEADTIQEIRKLNKVEMKKRNLDSDKNDCYSLVIND